MLCSMQLSPLKCTKSVLDLSQTSEKMEEHEFKIRSYGFQELAQLYLPNIQPRSASVRLRTWIDRNQGLSSRLEQLGFLKGCRILTPEMVKEIVEVVGEP